MSPRPGSQTSPSLSVTSPADILSYVPHALGFMPSESLVVLTTAGSRLGATLRVDLPPVGADTLIFAEGVLSFLRGDTDADGALVVVYTGTPWTRPSPAPHADMVLTVESVLRAAGLPIRGGWLVAPSGWRDYFCRDEECCPWPGEPLDTVVDSALNAALIFGGSVVDASAPEAVLRATPAVAPGADPSAADLDAIDDALSGYAMRCAGLWTTTAQFRATSGLWDAVLERSDGSDVMAEPDIAGFLLASIESRTVRDFLLASACLGSASALAGAAACGLVTAGPSPSASAAGECGMPAAGWILPGGVEAILPGAVLDEEPDAEPTDLGARSTGGAGTGPVPQAGGSGAESGYVDVLAGRYLGPIRWDRVDAMTEVLARLAAVSVGESRASALTMSAWFEYARGRGSRAAVYLDAAEQAVPGYRLARLLHELLRRGALPAWATARATAWTAGAARASRTSA